MWHRGGFFGASTRRAGARVIIKVVGEAWKHARLPYDMLQLSVTYTYLITLIVMLMSIAATVCLFSRLVSEWSESARVSIGAPHQIYRLSSLYCMTAGKGSSSPLTCA